MLNLNDNAKIWLCAEPTDMRKSFDGLVAMTKTVLQKNPLNGDWFVFINRKQSQMKVLYFATGGYALWCKRLEKGTFTRLKNSELSLGELLLLIDGIDLKSGKNKARFSLQNKP